MKEKAIAHYKNAVNPHWKKFDNKAAAEFMPKSKIMLASIMQAKIFKPLESARNSARGSAKGSARGLINEEEEGGNEEGKKEEEEEEGNEEGKEEEEEEEDGFSVISETKVCDNINESGEEEEEEDG